MTPMDRMWAFQPRLTPLTTSLTTTLPELYPCTIMHVSRSKVLTVTVSSGLSQPVASLVGGSCHDLASEVLLSFWRSPSAVEGRGGGG